MKILTYEYEKNAKSTDWEPSLRRVLEQGGYQGGLSIEKPNDELLTKIRDWDGTEPIELIFNAYMGGSPDIALFISSANQLLEDHCRSAAPKALYGCCLPGNLVAVEYAPKNSVLSTQLHETLHLFGVGECYDPDTLERIPECDNENCVMGYGVNSTEVCSHVLGQIGEAKV